MLSKDTDDTQMSDISTSQSHHTGKIVKSFVTLSFSNNFVSFKLQFDLLQLKLETKGLPDYGQMLSLNTHLF